MKFKFSINNDQDRFPSAVLPLSQIADFFWWGVLCPCQHNYVILKVEQLNLLQDTGW